MTMRRWLYLSAIMCLAVAAGFGALHYGTGASMPNPEDGSITAGAYTNEYFDLSYPLPSEWTEDLAGPGASGSGYYTLGTFVPPGELTGTIMIAAQDMFFAAGPQDTAVAMVADFHHAMSEIDGMTIDQAPLQTTMGGRDFHRVDFSGVGLYRAMLATEIRCHLVSFNITTSDPERRAALVTSVNNLSSPRGGKAGSAGPPCIKDYASDANVLHKVEPVFGGSVVESIPARIIVGTDGGVKHVHVIRATPERRDEIVRAVAQLKLKPFLQNGRPVAVETGLVFRPTFAQR